MKYPNGFYSFFRLIFLLVFLLCHIGVIAQQYKYRIDTIFNYRHDLNTEVPDSSLSFIEVYEANLKGYQIKYEQLDWDTTNSVFLAPDFRILSWPDESGNDTLKETYILVNSDLELHSSIQRRYNKEGIKVYEYALQNNLHLQSAHPRINKLAFRDDGKILSDSLWTKKPNSNWILDRYTEYLYENDLITAKWTYKWQNSAGDYQPSEAEITTYNSQQNIIAIEQFRWSDILNEIQLKYRDSLTYAQLGQLEENYHFRWNSDQNSWEARGKDSMNYPAPDEVVRTNFEAQSGGEFAKRYRTRTIENDSLTSLTREYPDSTNGWKLEYKHVSNYDSLGSRIKYEDLRLSRAETMDTIRYLVETYLVNDDRKSAYFFRDVKRLGRKMAREYTRVLFLVPLVTFPPQACNLLEVSFFPNPTTGKVTFQLPENGDSQIRVFTTTGKIVMNKTITADFVELGLGDLVPGLYIIQVHHQGQIATCKLVLQQ